MPILTSLVSAALNGGSTVWSVDALDYYRGEGGYGHAKEVVPQSRLYGCWKGADQFANDFFQAAVSRRPTTNELDDWTARLQNAQGEAQLLAEARGLGAQVFNSTEYAARNRSDQESVTDLFRAYLQRAPDAGGLSFWTGEITPCGGD